MNASTPRVCIVVVRPADPARAAAGARTLEALDGLGPEVRVEVTNDAESCVRLARERPADLVVLDPDCEGAPDVLRALRATGPPVIAVTPERGEDAALEAFRGGAADCVALGSDYTELLPQVALEQIRRWRGLQERIATERHIRRLEELNTAIVEQMSSGVLVVDPQGRIAFSNPTAETLLGVEREALRGSPLRDRFPEPERADRFTARALQEGEPLKGAEEVVLRADGRRVPVGASCAPLRGARGEPLGAVVLFQDQSEIKQLQQQVLQAEKLASIGQLAAGVAHEINNPMGFIHANLFQIAEYVQDLQAVWDHVEALRRAVAGGPPGAAERAAEDLDRAARDLGAGFLLSDLEKAVRESLEGSERIRHIVRDLREFSHRGGDDWVLADLNQCLDSTANIVWSMMKHAAVLERDYGRVPAVAGSPMQLKQVFMNLLVNACQAVQERPAGAVPPARVRLRTRCDAEWVTVEVSDSGPGIPPEHLDRIFDPFFTTKEVGVGTGLGLSTSFHIVRRHGGTIRVESAPGRGATFEVVLPRPRRRVATGAEAR